jgi:hypothetical protein
MLSSGNVSAHETIYIGDNYCADVVGAQQDWPVLYDPQGVFRKRCATIKSFDELNSILKVI